MFKWLYFEHTENKLKRLLGADIPKTAEELALDKKNRENEEFFDDIARHSSLRYDYLGQNINNDD